MQSPPVTIDELLSENHRLREIHDKDLQILRWTLRDSFASAALSGLIALHAKKYQSAYARSAYDIADAMMAERQKRIGGAA